MAVIENFAAVSVEEQRNFAEALLKTINSENTFSDKTKFELDGLEADDINGGIWIGVSHTNTIEVSRDATWSCDSADDAEDDPGFEADYSNYLFEDAKKAFKTLSTVIDGYKVSLEISDVDEGETVRVEVDSVSHEDSGIGDYEYWGTRGHDSQPYVEVQGTIVKECECYIAFYVEPDDAIEPQPDEEL